MQAAKTERKKGKKADLEADLLAKVKETEGPRSRDRRKAPRDRQGGRRPASSPRPGTACRPTPTPTTRSSASSRPPGKFKSRYASFGFNEAAKLDDGNMWPTSFALTKLGDAEEKKIAALVKKAAG